MRDIFHAKQDSLREDLRQLVRDLHKSHGWHSDKQVSREKALREEMKSLKNLMNEKKGIDNDGRPIEIDGELEQSLNILLSFSRSMDTHKVMTMARKAMASWDDEIDVYRRAIAEARIAHSIASTESDRTLRLLRRAEAGYSSDE